MNRTNQRRWCTAAAWCVPNNSHQFANYITHAHRNEKLKHVCVVGYSFPEGIIFTTYSIWKYGSRIGFHFNLPRCFVPPRGLQLHPSFGFSFAMQRKSYTPSSRAYSIVRMSAVATIWPETYANLIVFCIETTFRPLHNSLCDVELHAACIQRTFSVTCSHQLYALAQEHSLVRSRAKKRATRPTDGSTRARVHYKTVKGSLCET